MIERRVHMPQLVFLHGPSAGGCAEAFHYQLNSFPGSLAPTLPGHGTGASCVSVERYTEWVQGWLWAQGRHQWLPLPYAFPLSLSNIGLDGGTVGGNAKAAYGHTTSRLT
jgi:hypothetical protein